MSSRLGEPTAARGGASQDLFPHHGEGTSRSSPSSPDADLALAGCAATGTGERMNQADPPRLSTWLLQRWAFGQRRQSMAGDLIEQYRDGRSAMWYRRQVLTTIVAAAVADVREHKLFAVRAIAIWFVATIVLNWLTASLRRVAVPMVPQFGGMAVGDAAAVLGLVRRAFALLLCVGYAAIGWTIARAQRDYTIGMVVLCAAIPLVPATQWGWRTWTLLQAGLWPDWGMGTFRLALLFQMVCLFTVYPLCILLGGFWGVRAQADRASPTPSS